jgi:hypothetical protein
LPSEPLISPDAGGPDLFADRCYLLQAGPLPLSRLVLSPRQAVGGWDLAVCVAQNTSWSTLRGCCASMAIARGIPRVVLGQDAFHSAPRMAIPLQAFFLRLPPRARPPMNPPSIHGALFGPLSNVSLGEHANKLPIASRGGSEE